MLPAEMQKADPRPGVAIPLTKPEGRPKIHRLDLSDKTETLHTVFSPAAPIRSRDFFMGRFEQLRRVEQAVREPGQHIVLFGERGVGKTSFANIIETEFGGTKTAKLTCSRNLQFTEIWKELLRKAWKAFNLDPGALAKIPATLDPFTLVDALSGIEKPYLFIFDEFDSVSNKAMLGLFADTVKSLSDNLPHLHCMFVGIGLSVKDLIGEHASLERCLRQVHLPRMSEEELSEIVDKGLMRLKMNIDKSVRADVIEFSQGFPHYTHLLAKYAVENALKLRYQFVARNNFDSAIDEAIVNAHESIRSAYQSAVTSRGNSEFYQNVVWACALVKEDDHGSFKAADLRPVLEKLSKKSQPVNSYGYHLSKLCLESRGQMLAKETFGKQIRYHFRNPILRAYITLELYRKGVLREFR